MCTDNLENNTGFSWDAKKYTFLVYADDLVLAAETKKDLKSNFDTLCKELGKAGLEVNAAKSASQHQNV